ncbi:ATP-binding protein, partial [Myxococcota bacterium]|nr:ATP-binding protein [Myxococcota bacterium]
FVDHLARDGAAEARVVLERGGSDRLLLLRGAAIGAEHFSICALDVTEAQRAEHELRAAKELAEEAARTKTQFLATMSHEIRTPLNGVIGATELLLASPRAPREAGLIEIVKHSADTLLSVVNDVLDFSKIEAGRLELELVPFVVRDAVLQVLELLSSNAKRKGLVLTTRLDPSLDRAVVGDPVRVRQVLMNLVSNALKFTSQGEIVIRGAASLEGGVDRVRLEVADTGVGIAPHVIPQLFQPFHQADGSTTRRYGGTGLGLAICKRLVESMGGTIGVDSVEGRGSTFWLVVPFTPGGDTDDDALATIWSDTSDTLAVTKPFYDGPSQPFEPVGPAPVRASTISEEIPVELLSAAKSSSTADASPMSPLARRVLVAEDNPVSRLVLARMLELLGYHPDLVSDGRQAIQAALHDRYACVLMDCQMPDVDGLEATRRIRALEAGRWHTPIIAITANARPEDRTHCLAAGMDDFVPKPLELARLRALLEQWTKSRHDAT